MSILGNRVTRSEDPRFITGTATFGDDIETQGALHATFVRSILGPRPVDDVDTAPCPRSPAPARSPPRTRRGPLPVGSPASTRR